METNRDYETLSEIIRVQLGVSSLIKVQLADVFDVLGRKTRILLDFELEKAESPQKLSDDFFTSLHSSLFARRINNEQRKEIKTLQDEKNLLEIEIEELTKYKNFVEVQKEINNDKNDGSSKTNPCTNSKS